MARQTPPDHSSPENDLLFNLEAFVPARAAKAPAITSVSFGDLVDPPLLLHEDLKDGCGGQVWPAGMVLAKYLLRHHKESLSQKTILELGAGGGLVGLAVARACHTTKPILITDQLPMLSLMQQNIALNALQDKVQAAILDWGTPFSHPTYHHLSTPAPSMAEEQPYPDMILAADCVYFEPAFPLLLETMQQLLGPQTICYFCFKKRRKADWRFVKAMKKQFDVVEVAVYGRDQVEREGIHLYEVRRKGHRG